MSLAPREYPVFRPYWRERPTQLLQQSIEESDLDWIRIAKHHGQVIAAYRIEQQDVFNYSILSIAVDSNYRHQGIGRWMVLHAVGLIESKGGRVVHVTNSTHDSWWVWCGFSVESPGHCVMRLTPD